MDEGCGERRLDQLVAVFRIHLDEEAEDVVVLDAQARDGGVGCVLRLKARDDGAGVFLQGAGLVQRRIEAGSDEAAIARLNGEIACKGGGDLVGEGADARLVGQCEGGAGGGDFRWRRIL